MANAPFIDFRYMFGGIFRRALNVVKRPFYNYSFLNTKNPVVIDMERLLDVYLSCPQWAMVINKKADMLSNGKLKARNIASGEDMPNHWALKLMRTPNPSQSFKTFTYQCSIYFDIYSNSFIYRNQPFENAKSKPVTLWNLPPELIKIVPTGKWLDQTSIEGIVDKYELYGMASVPIREFTTNEVIHFHEGISKSNLKSDSKAIALQMHITNCIGALKTRNIFIYYGPKQIISNNSQDKFGVQKIADGERSKIENQFNKEDYGIDDSQSHTIISSAALKVDKLSYPTKDLMLFEECEESIQAFCGAYGIKRDIFPSTKGATFENQEEAEKSTYYGTIAQTADSYCAYLGKVLNLEDEGIELYLDYSHLPVMQNDLLVTAKTKESDIKAFSQMYRDGIISAERYAELAGEETLTGDGKLKSNKNPKNDPNGN